MILEYLGFCLPVSVIISGCKTDKDGTRSEDAVRFLRSLNLKSVLSKSGELSKIISLVARGYPVVVDVKDRLLSPNKPLKNDDEHVVVVIGFNKTRIYYLDSLRKRRPQSLAIAQFKRAFKVGERKFFYIKTP
jgi:uncharacterized protein YvpB